LKMRGEGTAEQKMDVEKTKSMGCLAWSAVLLPEDESNHNNQNDDFDHKGWWSLKPIASCQWVLDEVKLVEQFISVKLIWDLGTEFLNGSDGLIF
jgi:hypothetical protein